MLVKNMSTLQRRWILFCAEYLVIIEGILFFLCIIQVKNVEQQLKITISGVVIVAVSLIIAKLLKKLIHKRRPLKRKELFNPFDRYAFPSAHASVLFALSTFLLMQHFWIGLASLTVAIFIVVARVYSRVHDFADIAGGFVIGTAVSYYLAPYVTTYVDGHLLSSLLARTLF